MVGTQKRSLNTFKTINKSLINNFFAVYLDNSAPVV